MLFIKQCLYVDLKPPGPQEELWRNLEHKANWHRIAARMTARGFGHSAKEYYIRYRHQVHPMLQKGHFTKEEAGFGDEKVQKIVTKKLLTLDVKVQTADFPGEKHVSIQM